MFKTEEAKRFFAAWLTLRKGGGLPHYRAVFQDLPNEFLPQALIFEQVLDGQGLEHYTIRFQGTRAAEYGHRDLTGDDILSVMAPKIAAAGRRNLGTVLSHPCGLVTVGVFTLDSQVELAVEGVMVPTANDPGRPARVLAFVQQLKPPFPLADDRRNTAERHWLDIGSGVPNRKPAS